MNDNNSFLSRITALTPASNWALPVLACLAVLVARWISPPVYDVTALLTWAERMVDGARPFVDFVEVNPPGSILVYIPAVVFARATGLPAEIAAEVLQCGLIALSLALGWRALSAARLLEGHKQDQLLAALIAILGVMPAVTFGQREHIGVVAVLPILAVTAAEGTGNLPAYWLRLAAGILAGISMIAKPHFAMILGGAAAFSVYASGRLSHAFRVQWIAAGVTIGAYLGLTWWAYPEFYTVALPKIVDVYLGWRIGIVGLLANPILVIVSIVLLMLRRQHAGRTLTRPTLLLSLAALLAAAMFYLQGRGWPYHGLPALALIAIALAWEATRIDNDRADPVPAAGGSLAAPSALHMLAALGAITVASYMWTGQTYDRRYGKIVEIINETHPRPRMLSIAEDISVGHPLVRMVQGTWTHKVTHLWAAFGVYHQLNSAYTLTPERRARLLGHLKAEVVELAAAIEREKPDIIVAQRNWVSNRDFDWLAWAHKWPALHTLLDKDYTSVGRVDDVEILKRNVIAEHPQKTNAKHAVNSRAP